jgi:hypothetical protein
LKYADEELIYIGLSLRGKKARACVEKLRWNELFCLRKTQHTNYGERRREKGEVGGKRREARKCVISLTVTTKPPTLTLSLHERTISAQCIQ